MSASWVKTTINEEKNDIHSSKEYKPIIIVRVQLTFYDKLRCLFFSTFVVCTQYVQGVPKNQR